MSNCGMVTEKTASEVEFHVFDFCTICYTNFSYSSLYVWCMSHYTTIFILGLKVDEDSKSLLSSGII